MEKRPSSPSRQKTDNGTDDSTCNEMRTWMNWLTTLSETSKAEVLDTVLSEDPKLAQDHIKTITRSATSMLQSSSSIEEVNVQSFSLGVSRLETVIISFRGTELCLSPDGVVTISKTSQKSIPGSAFFMKWGRFRKV